MFQFQCSNCGQKIPYDGNVCPFCHIDKSADKQRYYHEKIDYEKRREEATKRSETKNAIDDAGATVVGCMAAVFVIGIFIVWVLVSCGGLR